MTKKRLILLGIGIVLFMIASFSQARANDKKYFYDMGDLVPEQQEIEIEQQLAEYSKNKEIDFVVIATDSSLSGESQEYENLSENYFFDHDFGYGEDKTGMVLTFDMTNRKIDIRGMGKAQKTFSYDSNIDTVVAAVGGYLKESDYSNAVSAFINTGYQLYSETLSEADSISDNSSRKSFKYRVKGLFKLKTLGVALVIAIIAVIVAYFMHNSIVSPPGTYYEKEGGFVLTNQEDQFMYKNVVTRKIQRSDSSSSSSSSNRSSSGRSSGGTRGF